MEIRTLSGQDDLMRYDAWVKAHPQGTLWQSLAWKYFQDALGRQSRIYVAEENGTIVASALVTVDRTAFNWSVWEMMRGPIGSWQLAVSNLLTTIKDDAKRNRALCIFMSPTHSANSQLPIANSKSRRHLMPEATRIIDLTQTEDAILAQMKPKGRYNIGVAEKNGVTVEYSQDINAFYQLLKSTGGRDGFGILPKRHYEAFLKHLDGTFLLLAYAPTPSPLPRTGGGVGGESMPIAGLLGVVWNGMAFYYYGASSYADRALMAPYALQWEAIRHAKTQGCRTYDLLGVAPPSTQQPTTPNQQLHPWAGISSFKEKFGGTVITYPQEQMITLRPIAWAALQVKRKLWR